ncbi:MAG: Npun_R2821/Npun_R2822 family protein [Leptolyngbyaceae cyanobacterium]
MLNGICTLANDAVYHQVVALINSIEANAGSDFPVCIFPYDSQLTKLLQLAEQRPQVSVYSNSESIQSWDNFVERLWKTHPNASDCWLAAGTSQGIHRMGTHRRYCAFDGPFDNFLYMDADTLLLDPVDELFDLLSQHDWVTYDFQYKDPSHVYEVSSPKLQALFSKEQIEDKIFCSGFYASKKGLFQVDKLDSLLDLLKSGEAEILYPLAPDQTILNYLVMRLNINSVNLARVWPSEMRTGNSVTSSHFNAVGEKVFDKGKPLLYLHYIGVSSKLFRHLCEGENVDFPYRDVFLHYRYLHNPSERPVLKGKPKPYKQGESKFRRILKKLARKN